MAEPEAPVAEPPRKTREQLTVEQLVSQLSPTAESVTDSDTVVTPEQHQAIVELKAVVKSLPAESLPPFYIQDFAAVPDIFVVKFLIARKWNVTDAAKMITESAKYRLEKQLDTTPRFPPSVTVRGFDIDELAKFQGLGSRPYGEIDKLNAVVKQGYSAAWHKWDKEGRPLFIERTGHTKPRRLLAMCRSVVPPGGDISVPSLNGHINSNETGGIILRYQDSQRPDPTGTRPYLTQVSCIMDCDGLGMKHLFGPAMDLLKVQATVDQAYYPEGLYRLYVANAPTMIIFAWSIVKRWVDPRTHKKVVFLRPEETKEKLLEVVDEDCLPDFLGGKCHCEGECVPDVVGQAGEDDVLPSEWDLACTEELNVGRGAQYTREIDVEAGETICWEYCLRQRDIQFQAEFTSDDPSKPPLGVCSVRSASGAGTFEAPTNGKLRLLFDNKTAWWNSKIVDLRITRTPPAAPTEVVPHLSSNIDVVPPAACTEDEEPPKAEAETQPEQQPS